MNLLNKLSAPSVNTRRKFFLTEEYVSKRTNSDGSIQKYRVHYTTKGAVRTHRLFKRRALQKERANLSLIQKLVKIVPAQVKPKFDNAEDTCAKQFGPIPSPSSKIFAGLCFLLTAFDKLNVDKKLRKCLGEECAKVNEWNDRPFDKERLIRQILAGGGKVFNNFEHVPPSHYRCTMHITDIPTESTTNLLCLSVGIQSFSHQWIIRCCESVSIRDIFSQLSQGERYFYNAGNSLIFKSLFHSKKKLLF